VKRKLLHIKQLPLVYLAHLLKINSNKGCSHLHRIYLPNLPMVSVSTGPFKPSADLLLGMQ